MVAKVRLPPLCFIVLISACTPRVEHLPTSDEYRALASVLDAYAAVEGRTVSSKCERYVLTRPIVDAQTCGEFERRCLGWRCQAAWSCVSGDARIVVNHAFSRATSETRCPAIQHEALHALLACQSGDAWDKDAQHTTARWWRGTDSVIEVAKREGCE